MDYIERHYTEDLSIDSICQTFKISPSSVHRICKRAFNKSFKEHIAELRLREARALIIKRDYLPSSVAKLVGYKSYSSFFRAYKKAFGNQQAGKAHTGRKCNPDKISEKEIIIKLMK